MERKGWFWKDFVTLITQEVWTIEGQQLDGYFVWPDVCFN